MNRITLLLASVALVPAALLCSCGRDKVSLSEDERTYTLSNSMITAVVAKESGDLVSVKYQGKEMLAVRMDREGRPDLELDPPGANPNGLNKGMTDHQYGFWSHDAMGPRGTRDAIASITIDPSKTAGRRAEVSVKGISEGRKMGTGPGSSQDGQFAADIEIRYALEAGSPKIYTYCVFTHPESYPASAIGEARFCAKLAPMFDWMSVDKDVDFYYPADHFAGDKYVYTAVQSENQAFGWSSTSEGIGCFLLNPSMEYMSGGPTKVEFLGHRDTNKAAAPCILNYWRSSHYGGAEVSVEQGEFWQKVIGPFVLYFNSGSGHEHLYADARAQVEKERRLWPYSWVDTPAYAGKNERSRVSGRIALDDELASCGDMTVGLVDPEAFWQRDAKHYQFWTKADRNGEFVLDNVIPGTYTMVSFADGVLGEFREENVRVDGKKVNLGTMAWKPVRKGRQIFEIGIANRNGSEFALGTEFRDPEIVLNYAKLYPQDVDFTIGESDFSKDWPYLHVPHNELDDVQVLPFFGIRADGRETPYRINFDVSPDDLSEAASDKAVLRLALCGTAAQSLEISVNGQHAGSLPLTQTRDGVITRHGSHGIWHEEEFAFDASLLSEGRNNLVITMPSGSLNSGILYDYLRLEL